MRRSALFSRSLSPSFPFLVLGLLALAAVLAGPASGQGRTDYMNVESPHVHPIEVVRLGGYDYVLVCNTADGTVEILDTNETLPPASRLLARVQVGQEPVSVRFNPATGRFYTANFLGDSISVVEISAPSGPGSLVARLDHTTLVGDEPMDVSFFDNAGTPTLFVTHMSLDGFGWRDALTLAPVVPGVTERLDASVPVGTATHALKEPRTTLVDAQGVYILGHKGGNLPLYDFDIFAFERATSTFRRISGVGTTNFNMALASNGDLFVVGQDAVNRTLFTEPNVAAACTGFAPSILTRVRNPSTATPTVLKRDLNALAGAGCNPVAKNIALSQPTDLALLENNTGVQKVFISALGSDRIGVIVPNSGTPINWPRRTINVAPINPASPKAGPVALALKGTNLAVPTDPGARLYVLNRFDYSVTHIDPLAETVVTQTPLAVDPRPAHILAGQHFLYDAEQSSSGFSACSSCHPYGRTDGLAWDLGAPGVPQAPLNLNFVDGIVEFVQQPPPSGPWVLTFATLLDRLANGFLDDKGLMVSQSLQGLLNFEVELGERIFVTNAPYYWRGTRFDFPDFNGGFTDLLLGPGLTTAEMNAYHEFINTIHYPPNPQQLKDRVFSGTVGVAPGTSTLAQSGLELFHTRPLCVSPGCTPEIEGNRSCVHCHALPEGSNNRGTEILGAHQNPAPMDAVVLETAALRGLIQKESRLDKSGLVDSTVITGAEGLEHGGFSTSINGFINVFGVFFPGTELADVKQFVHELDWGVGPIVGVPQTVDASNAGSALAFTPPLGCGFPGTVNWNAIVCMEDQADIANTGVAVRGELNGTTVGFWYDPAVTPPVYRQEGGGLVLTTANLIAQIGPRDHLVFQAVPLGSERRIASPSGTTTALSGPAPSALNLLPMVPNSAYRRVQTLTANWDDFDWPHDTQPLGPTQPQPLFPHTIKLYQQGLIQEAAAQNGFGLGPPGTPLRHDAPRRFRVSGRGIRHGAQLEIFVPSDVAGPPNPSGPLSQINTLRLAMPLYPTTERNAANSHPVWQTAVELEPLIYYLMMSGGPGAPGVAAALTDWFGNISEPPPAGFFDPLRWNFHFVRVINQDGSVGNGGWQPIFVQ